MEEGSDGDGNKMMVFVTEKGSDLAQDQRRWMRGKLGKFLSQQLFCEGLGQMEKYPVRWKDVQIKRAGSDWVRQNV